MRPLTNVERRVARHHGKPADLVSVLEKLMLHEVLEARLALRQLGIVGVSAFAAPGPCVEDQLSLDLHVHANHSPPPVDAELEYTTTTDPEGW